MLVNCRCALQVSAVIMLVGVWAMAASADSVLIPVPDRRDHVFDPVRGQLLISTARGVVERFDNSTGVLGAPLSVSGVPQYGIDIAADASFAMVASSGGYFKQPQGFVSRVDLQTGAVVNYTYDYGFYEGGGYDVAIAANGKALFTTWFYGSGWTLLREVDPATGVITPRTDAPPYFLHPGGSVRGRSQVNRSKDRSLLFFQQFDTSNGPVFTYGSATDAFSNPCLDTGFFDGRVRLLIYSLSAVSRDGALIALEMGNTDDPVRIFTRDLGFVTDLNSVRGGIAFDPIRDILYTVDSTNDLIIAWDTGTWSGLFAIPTDEDVSDSGIFDAGVMSVSPDGRWLFLSTPSGIRRYTLPAPPPPACPGDTNGDNLVNGADLSVLLGQFGQSVPSGTGADFNGDGVVNGADLSVLLGQFGSAC